MTAYRIYSPGSTRTVCEDDGTKLSGVPTEGIGGRGVEGCRTVSACRLLA
jgi:hypothetical protein